MSITAGQLVLAVEHRIGGPVSTAFGSTLAVVNKACRMFFSMHAWKMALNAEAELDLEAGEEVVSLPYNFLSLLNVERADGGRVNRTTLEALLTLRAQAQLSTGLVDWCAVESLSTMRIFRTPSADVDGGLLISYRSRFVDMDSPSDEVGISDFAEPALIEACREYAAGLEGGDLTARWNAFSKSELLMQCKTADGESQPIINEGAKPIGWFPEYDYTGLS